MTITTHEVHVLGGGKIASMKDAQKARAYAELFAEFYPHKVWLQTWNGSKLVTERCYNEDKDNG